MVVFAERGAQRINSGEGGIDLPKSERLAEALLGTAVQAKGLLPLDLAVWPSPNVVCAASLASQEIICARDLAKNEPSRLTDAICSLAAGRSAYGVFMDSAEDWAAFAVWSADGLVRSLSVSPEVGVIEDVGARFSFEGAFWEGGRPVRSYPGYALPFHPLELGNEALKEFFGFVLEGDEGDSCFDPEDFEVPSFAALR
ncbi:DUF6928 family protein [[Kitasatospora] papulosa]